MPACGLAFIQHHHAQAAAGGADGRCKTRWACTDDEAVHRFLSHRNGQGALIFEGADGEFAAVLPVHHHGVFDGRQTGALARLAIHCDETIMADTHAAEGPSGCTILARAMMHFACCEQSRCQTFSRHG